MEENRQAYAELIRIWTPLRNEFRAPANMPGCLQALPQSGAQRECAHGNRGAFDKTANHRTARSGGVRLRRTFHLAESAAPSRLQISPHRMPTVADSLLQETEMRPRCCWACKSVDANGMSRGSCGTTGRDEDELKMQGLSGYITQSCVFSRQ